MKSVSVFCGSSMGSRDIYREEAKKLAEYLCANDLELTYGGSNVGIMKILADTMLKNGGRVVGAIPQFLIDIEVGHTELTKLHIVETMQDRKTLLAEISDAFIAFPGGMGTLDELFEMITLTQLRVQDKPIGILNIEGYYDHLLMFLDRAVEDGFIRKEHRDNLMVSDQVEDLMEQMLGFEPVKMTHWIKDIKEES
jgi:uncharacterized protein (TIGR00730 family)